MRRLLEVGVTMTATGRRETGLERGEYDQGQHDTPHDVLAVTTAGMLVRRSVLEELPLDPELPVTHADLDLGLRANRTGHRVRVVPDAVVFHAEASRTGARERPVRGDRGAERAADRAGRPARRRRDREAAYYTVLAHASLPALVPLAVRLLLGSLLRAVGLLLVRAPREAWAEVVAVTATLGRPGRLRRGRALRNREATVPRSRLRPLLAPWWLPLRHGLDELGHLGAAAARQLAPERGSRWQRLRTSPFAWLLLLLVVASAVSVRGLVGEGRLLGGALLPAPESAWEWWRTYLTTVHDVGSGSTAAAPAYLLPLAVLGTLLLGSAALAVDLLVLGVVPLAAVGAHRFLRRLTGARAVSLWGAAAYAVLPVVGGAFAQGRFGTLVAAVVLPWLAASALRLTDPDPDRRRRGAWRTGLWLALGAAFAPQLWWAALAVTAAGSALLLVRGRGGDLVSWVVPVVASAALLLPWWVPVLTDRGAGALLDEAGLAAPRLLADVSALDLLGGRTATAGAAPPWVALALPLLAVLALARPGTRGRVLAAWSVSLAALGWLWLLAADGRQWLGLPLLVAHGGWIAAAAVAAAASTTGGASASGGRRATAGVVGALALVVPVAGLAWWATTAPAPGPGLVHRAEPSPVPVYLDDAADRDPALGTLVLAGDAGTGYDVAVRRGEPLALGDEGVLPCAGAADRHRLGPAHRPWSGGTRRARLRGCGLRVRRAAGRPGARRCAGRPAGAGLVLGRGDRRAGLGPGRDGRAHPAGPGGARVAEAAAARVAGRGGRRSCRTRRTLAEGVVSAPAVAAHRAPAVLAVLAPLVALALVLTVPKTAAPPDGTGAPTRSVTEPVARSTVACPPAPPVGRATRVAVVAGAVPGAVAAVPARTGRGTVLTRTGGEARGTFAARVDRGGDTLAVLACRQPAAQWWFAGAGGDLDHSSVLHLVNVDSGPAVVDVRLHGATGSVDLAGTRGLTLAPRDVRAAAACGRGAGFGGADSRGRCLPRPGRRRGRRRRRNRP